MNHIGQIARLARTHSLGLCLLIALIIPALSFGADQHSAHDPYIFDTRSIHAAVRSEADRERLLERDLGLARLQQRLPGVRTTWSPLFETPGFLRSLDAPLMTDPLRALDHPVEMIEEFLDAHTALFQADARVIGSTVVRRDAVSANNGIRSVWLQQQINGIDIEGADLRASFDSSGDLRTIGSRLLPMSALDASTNRALTPLNEATVRAAAGAVGIEHLGTLTIRQSRSDARLSVVDAELGTIGQITAAPVYLPITRSTLRLCQRVTLRPAHNQGAYEVFVDAQDRSVFLSRSLSVDSGETTPSYLVFTNDSPTPSTPGPQSPGEPFPETASRSVVTLESFDAHASPLGWLGADDSTTRGNNIESHADSDSDDIADLPLLQTAKPGTFHFPYSMEASHESNLNAAITQAFFTGNWFHDRMHQLGFTEPFGAFQRDNFGRGGVDGDPILIDVQDSRDTNNARFISSGADGGVGRVEMYIWNGGGESRDSALDVQILVHELTHGVSLRLHRGLEGTHAAGMGEGWSDFFALTMLAEETDDPDGVYGIGSFASFATGESEPFTDHHYFGLRRFPYSTDFDVNPLTFADIDPQQFSVSSLVPHNPIIPKGNPVRVHKIGEIWCSALWEVRAALIKAHGYEAGAELAEQLVIDGMVLTTTSTPNMVVGRDAILIADIITNGGENVCLLWEAFARRGLGIHAESPDIGVKQITESFAIPDEPRILPHRTAPGTVTPGVPTPVSLIVDRRCGESRSGSQGTLWRSINGEEFSATPMLEISEGVFESALPPLLCDDQIEYYFTIETDGFSQVYPELGAQEPLHTSGAPIIIYDVLQSEERGNFDHFGFAADRSQGLAIVGAFHNSSDNFNTGRAYIYSGGVSAPSTLITTLTSPNPIPGARFGFSVAINDSLACVGATGDDLRAPSGGAAHVFKQAGSDWVFDGSLTALDGDTGDEFGVSVSIDGSTIAVGSKGNDTQGSNAGAVYLYDREGPEQWSQTRRLIVLDGKPGDAFGATVDIQGDWLVAGAPNDDNAQGSVYVFRRTQGIWSLHSKLLAPTRRNNASFGVSIALDQHRVLIGAERDINQVTGVGIAYAFVYNESSDEWEFESSIGAFPLSGGDRFGSSVDLLGDIAVISAPRQDAAGERSGAVYVFENDAIEGWVHREGPLVPTGLNTPGIGIGSSVAIDEFGVTVGAWLAGDIFDSAGAAYTFAPFPADCDADGQADICAIAAGIEADANEDGIPDNCQCTGDLNADGLIDTADLGIMIAEFGQQNDSIADLNGDGIVDAADLGLFLLGMSSGCP